MKRTVALIFVAVGETMKLKITFTTPEELDAEAPELKKARRRMTRTVEL
jgi:hypothetical protein